jgi:hypothetical protein
MSFINMLSLVMIILYNYKVAYVWYVDVYV